MESKEYYFQDESPVKKQKFVLQNGKTVLNPANILFDHHKLEPK